MISQAFPALPLWIWLTGQCQCLGTTSNHVFSMTAWVHRTSLWQQPSDLARIFVPCLNSFFADKVIPILLPGSAPCSSPRDPTAGYGSHSVLLYWSCYVEPWYPNQGLYISTCSSLKIGPPRKLARMSNFVLRLYVLKPQSDVFSLHLLHERFCVQRIVLGKLLSCHPFLRPDVPLLQHITHGSQVEGSCLRLRRCSSNPAISHLLAFRQVFNIFPSCSVLITSWRTSIYQVGNMCHKRVWKSILQGYLWADQHKYRAVWKLKMSLLFIWSFLSPPLYFGFCWFLLVIQLAWMSESQLCLGNYDRSWGFL